MKCIICERTIFFPEYRNWETNIFTGMNIILFACKITDAYYFCAHCRNTDCGMRKFKRWYTGGIIFPFPVITLYYRTAFFSLNYMLVSSAFFMRSCSHFVNAISVCSPSRRILSSPSTLLQTHSRTHARSHHFNTHIIASRARMHAPASDKYAGK